MRGMGCALYIGARYLPENTVYHPEHSYLGEHYVHSVGLVSGITVVNKNAKNEHNVYLKLKLLESIPLYMSIK
jgi:hypothetical protein